MVLVLAFVLAFVAAVGGAAACGRAGAGTAQIGTPAVERGTATVDRVIDGDTLRVAIAGRHEAVRLIGIDTPETHGPGGLRECFGREAAARLTALLPPGSAVRLERDVEPRDRYDRLLAYVYRRRDGLFVNLSLAAEGYAAPLTIPPNIAHDSAFARAAAEARETGRGLWGACGNADVALDSLVDLPP